MNVSHLLPGCHVGRVCRIGPAGLQLEACGVRAGARCPAWGVWSEAGYGSYLRQPADLPLSGRSVRISLRVRRFRCRNVACARRTFAERLPGLLAAHARRTRRLAAAQGAVAVALGGEAGARLLPDLAMPTSADTLLRLVRARPLPTASTPTALGVDDWSFKRGSTYGTILVDLETRRVVDLLPDRRPETLAAWLRPRRRRAFPRGRTEQRTSAASRARSLARYEEVRQLYQAGESLRAIKKATGLARATVRRFARAESFPERAVRAPEPSRLDPFIPWLAERLAAGHENASALYRELRQRGYPGSSRPVHRWVQTQRTIPAKTTPPCRRDLPPVPGQAGASSLASPRAVGLAAGPTRGQARRGTKGRRRPHRTGSKRSEKPARWHVASQPSCKPAASRTAVPPAHGGQF